MSYCLKLIMKGDTLNTRVSTYDLIKSNQTFDLDKLYIILNLVYFLTIFE